MSVVFVASDSGGIRNVLPIAEHVAQQGEQVFLYTNLESPVLHSSFVDLSGVQMAPTEGVSPQAILDNVAPSFVVCGTTGSETLEKTITRAADSRGIPTVAVLDEWYNYRLRFEDESGQLTYLPDKIAAMNQRAIEEAVSEGVPKERLFISGSVWLSHLHHRSPWGQQSIQERSGDGRVRITFISENIEHDTSGVPVLPFTEQEVLNQLITFLDNTGISCHVTNKLHPSSVHGLPTHEGTSRVEVQTTRLEDLMGLITASDLCIGMKSMGLLEAAMVGVATVSFQPGLRPAENQSSAVKMGTTPLCTNLADLSTWWTERRDETKLEKNIWDFVKMDVSDTILMEMRKMK